MRDLIALVLRELFEFGAMQTDPNFANYRFQPDTGRLVLLDFGATRDVDPATAEGYRTLLAAGLAGDRDAVREAAQAAGFLGEAAIARHRPLVDRMIDIVVTEMNRPGPFDFGDRGFVEVLREHGMEMAADRSTWHIPPVETLFVQRKISGTALLAALTTPAPIRLTTASNPAASPRLSHSLDPLISALIGPSPCQAPLASSRSAYTAASV